MIPNILLVIVGMDSVVASVLKKIVFLIFSLALILLPLTVIKPKYYAILSVLLTPFILFEFYNIYTFKGPSSQEAIAALFYTNSHEAKELFKSNLHYALFFLILL